MADKLETGLRREVRAVLANPVVVLQELERDERVDADEVARLEKQRESIIEREKRLVRLYTYGEVDESIIRDEGCGSQATAAIDR